MDDSPLDHTLEAGGRLRILTAIGNEVFEFLVDIIAQILAEGVELDRAGTHDGSRIGIIDEAQKKMFERRIFVVALIGSRKRTMERLFEIT